MNKQECAKVLAKIQLGDNRQVDHLTLEEWFDTIGHLPFEDTITAVKVHRQESTDYLQPAHLIRIVARRQERALPPRAGGRQHREHPHSPGFCVVCGERISYDYAG